MALEAKQHAKEWLDRLKADFLAHGRSAIVFKQRTDYVDAIAVESYNRVLGPALPEGFAMLAVGGYGRRELFPHSDVDLLFLTRLPFNNPVLKESLSEFLKQLWDSGMRVSQSVRTIEECSSVSEGNFELTVSLLDHRLLAGDPLLFGRFRERFCHFLSAERRDIIRRLCKLARSRHARFHETIYRLEPDLKESPGGLRDLQTVRWLRSLREPGEVSGIDQRASEFLFNVRCFLHFQAGRDANLLSFEMQDELERWAAGGGRDAGAWMGDYFRNARLLWRTVLAELEYAESQDRSLLANFRDWRSRLSNADFTVSRDRVLLRNPRSLETDPELVLRLFEFVARHGIALAMDTEQRVSAALPALRQGLSGSHEIAGFWKTLLPLPGAADALRAARDTGFLEVLIPEWERIDHKVVRDFYHQYTVDEHTMVALEVIAALKSATDSDRQRFRQILEESEGAQWLLGLAILFHDIGKGSDVDHSEEAVRLAAHILGRHGVDSEDAETVLFLIRSHLDLSAVMQSRDIHDPETAVLVSRKVKTIERLRLLTLLTYADISAVNPAAMTAWRMEQLWRLYRSAARELTASLSGSRIEAGMEDRLTSLTPLMAEFLTGLPSRYLWTHTEESIRAHATLYKKASDSGVAHEVVRKSGVWQLTIASLDRPHLFASMCGVLSGFGLNILKAEAFANRRGLVLDTFTFADPHRNLDQNPPELDRLLHTLDKVATGKIQPEDLLKHRVPKKGAALSAIKAAVTLDNESSPSATVYEVVAADRPGLLYALASTISGAGCNIEVVLVDTEAHKAIDVFHVTRKGAKLEATSATELRDKLAAACSG